MKSIFIILFLLISFHGIGQVTNDIIPANSEYFVITEAYFIRNDSTYNIDEEFVEQRSGILFVPQNDSSIIIGINHGSSDKTDFLGYGKTIANPGFTSPSRDSEFYSWSYYTHGSTESKEAFIHKEYVAGSFEKRGNNYFYFGIHFSDNSEYQFYTYRITKADVEKISSPE